MQLGGCADIFMSFYLDAILRWIQQQVASNFVQILEEEQQRPWQ
jgi:hypothetical protein